MLCSSERLVAELGELKENEWQDRDDANYKYLHLYKFLRFISLLFCGRHRFHSFFYFIYRIVLCVGGRLRSELQT